MIVKFHPRGRGGEASVVGRRVLGQRRVEAAGRQQAGNELGRRRRGVEVEPDDALDGQAVHGDLGLAGHAVDRAGGHDALHVAAGVVGGGQQVAAHEEGQRGHQAVGAPVRDAGHDEVVPAAATDRLLAALPHPPQVVDFPDRGHNDLSDDPRFGAALAGFLR